MIYVSLLLFYDREFMHILCPQILLLLLHVSAQCFSWLVLLLGIIRPGFDIILQMPVSSPLVADHPSLDAAAVASCATPRHAL